MPRLSFYFFIFFVLFIQTNLQSQNVFERKQMYGPDPMLINGKVYNYFPGTGVKGHQYLNQKEFQRGYLVIHATEYKDVLLNYDLLNQEIILQYTDLQGSNRLLIVSKAWLEEINIAGETFSLRRTPDNQQLIVQTLNQGQIQLHVHWTKRLIADINLVSKQYVFESKKQIFFLTTKDTFQEYTSTKDLLQLFSDQEKEIVKRFMKQHKMKPKTNSILQLTELLDFCNQTLKEKNLQP